MLSKCHPWLPGNLATAQGGGVDGGQEAGTDWDPLTLMALSLGPRDGYFLGTCSAPSPAWTLENEGTRYQALPQGPLLGETEGNKSTSQQGGPPNTANCRQGRRG